MNRDGIWGVYVIMNALAIFVNFSLLISIWRLKEKKTSTEVLIGGLSSGILIGALGCGPQCLMSTFVGTFAFGDSACFAEAYLHLVGMEIQFISVAAISHRTFIGVVKVTPYSSKKATYIVAFAWCFAIFTTTFMGYFSKYYLVASGTFCFYEWTSPALIFAAWPMACVSLLLMGYWYWRTFQSFQTVREGAKEFRKEQEHSSSSLDRDLAVRLSVLVIFFLFGYIGIISQSLYEIFIGRAKAWGDIVAALMVLSYWDCIAFCYAHANKRLGLRSVLFMLPDRLVRLSMKEQTTGSRIMSVNSASGDETDGSRKFQLTKLKSQKGKEFLSITKEIEITSMGGVTDILGPSMTRGKNGIERLEGPRDCEPFLAVGDDDFGQRFEREDAVSSPDESRAKQIFNPFNPQSSPSVCSEFEFPSIQTTENDGTSQEFPSVAIPTDQSVMVVGLTHLTIPFETPRSEFRSGFDTPVPLASPSSLPPDTPDSSIPTLEYTT